MSSILTNTSSMVALQTLKGINQNLNKTQQEISTGKSISSAKDNSAIWAISKVMESDVSGFKAISDSLSLGESSVAVARNASESITDLLTEIKSKVVAAQEENVDRSKIQTDISKLQEQITSITDAAQFNGLNLLKGTDDVKILSSLDRGSDGTVSSRQITIDRQNLEQVAGTFGAGEDLTAATATGSLLDTSATGEIQVTGTTGTIAFTLGGETFSETFDTDAGTTAAALEAAVQGKIDDGTLKNISMSRSGDTLTFTSTGTAAVSMEAGTGTTSDLGLEITGDTDGTLTYSGTAGAAFSIGDHAFSVAHDTDENTTAANMVTAIQAKIDDGTLSGLSVSATLAVVTITSDSGAVYEITGGTGAVATGADDVSIDGIGETVTFNSATELEEGHSFRVAVGENNYDVVASGADDYKDIAVSMAAKITADSADTGVTAKAAQDANGNWTVEMVNGSDSALAVSLTQKADGVVGGGLEDLASIDVSTEAGAIAALESIEGLIQTSIDAAAAYGSAQSRIETQSDFISKLTDSLKGGIGTMVDADMEETSARLQALQVQQQLGIQSLSIANQAPQSIMSLFR